MKDATLLKEIRDLLFGFGLLVFKRAEVNIDKGCITAGLEDALERAFQLRLEVDHKYNTRLNY